MNNGFYSIIGKSGSGKSTLLNCISLLDKYDSGNIFYDGIDIKSLKDKDIKKLLNHKIGFIFQEHNLLEDLTVFENLSLTNAIQGETINNDEINDLLAKLDILHIADKSVNKISTGQKMRVAVARALVKEPEIIFADEPTASLDSKNSKEMLDILKQYSKDITVILVTHDKDYAYHYSDEVIEIIDGEVSKIDLLNEIKPIKQNKRAILKSKGISYITASKLVLKSIRGRKLRISFTIFLASISFLLLAVSSIFVMYDKNRVIISSNNKIENNLIYMQQSRDEYYSSSISTRDTNIDYTEVNSIKEKYHDSTFLEVYDGYEYDIYDLISDKTYSGVVTNNATEISNEILNKLNVRLIIIFIMRH